MASAAAAKSASAFITTLLARGRSRGYTAAAAAASSSSSDCVVSPTPLVLTKGSPEGPFKSAWGPDPLTGYYRPDNLSKEIDAAELRRLLLSNSKNLRSH